MDNIKSYKQRKWSFTENYFFDINTQDKAYVLGFISADGYHYPKQYSLNIRIKYNDKDILDKIKSKMLYNGPKKSSFLLKTKSMLYLNIDLISKM